MSQVPIRWAACYIRLSSVGVSTELSSKGAGGVEKTRRMESGTEANNALYWQRFYCASLVFDLLSNILNRSDWTISKTETMGYQTKLFINNEVCINSLPFRPI